MIDLPQNQLETVKRILSEHVAECEVRLFGSRVRGNAKPWSDLDMAIMADSALDKQTLYSLREAFEESDLPIRIDVLDWHAISPEFQTVINEEFCSL
jgi:predicted nucleotidyltransferase